MNPAYFLPLLALFLILLASRREEQMMVRRLQKHRRAKEITQMVTLAKHFLNKECLIYTFNGTQITGTVKEVGETAILIENGETLEVVNLDLVVRLREFPRKKNGKKKSVVLD